VSTGTIILLNGASSSGKTSILQALQDSLEEPYLNAGIDKFIWMLPERYLERPLWDEVLGLAIEAGEPGRRLFSGMHHAIAGLAWAGNNVLADHVLVEQMWLEECTRLFHGLNAYLVGIYCPLEILEQREALRRNRTPGQARLQFPRVHASIPYDLVVDSSLYSPQDCARLIMERMAAAPPTALPGLYSTLTGINDPDLNRSR
jgi:chloramphenicol 3-O phosphotransferase